MCCFEILLFTFFFGRLMCLSTMSFVIVQRDRVVVHLQVSKVMSSKSSNFGVVEMCIRV